MNWRRWRERFAADLALIDAGAERLKQLEKAAAEADKRFRAAAEKLSAARAKAADEARTRPSMRSWRR